MTLAMGRLRADRDLGAGPSALDLGGHYRHPSGTEGDVDAAVAHKLQELGARHPTFTAITRDGPIQVIPEDQQALALWSEGLPQEFSGWITVLAEDLHRYEICCGTTDRDHDAVSIAPDEAPERPDPPSASGPPNLFGNGIWMARDGCPVGP
jgi:hypothetical protein